MKLHYRKLGTGKPLFILHGLFGSSDNWQTLGKQLAESYTVYFVDQRNHGHSPNSTDFSYPLMADDFYELVTDLGLSNINIIGHSMGGKTAIQFAVNHAALIDKMIIGDISHKGYPPHHDQIIAGLNAIDLDFITSRGAADKKLAEYVPEIGTRQFLLKNLYWIDKGQLGWRINIPVLSREINLILNEIEFDEIDCNTLFVRGGKSNYILESDYDSIHAKFPNSAIHTIEESGHWLHAEAPKEFYETVVDFID